MSDLDPDSDRQTFRPNAVAARAVAIAAAIAFAVFVTLKGVPTLRHDWNWPIDAAAIPSFVEDSFSGWLPAGFGIPNAHPTAYIIALPLVAAMWLLGPLAALVLLAFVAGYLCVRGGAALAAHWTAAPAASAGIGMFALFNPWVYNEVVAGHLVMVLSYGALLGCIAEMLRGREASSVRLALWLALIEAQLQFFIVAMLALIVFAAVTKKWLPLAAGALFILPSAIGVAAERGWLLQTPYGLTWQSNQSVEPAALFGLGGYFPGYADRLGTVASIAVWLMLALAALGTFFARRSRAMIAAAVAAIAIFFHRQRSSRSVGAPVRMDGAAHSRKRRLPRALRSNGDFCGVARAIGRSGCGAPAAAVRRVSGGHRASDNVDRASTQRLLGRRRNLSAPRARRAAVP